MKKIVLVYGLLSGAVAAVLMLVTLPFVDELHGPKGLIVGFTGIILSGLLIYFGIRSYRENVLGGTITFGRGFQVGVLIALISSACYVATWELVYFKLKPDMFDKIVAGQIQDMRASGASEAAVAAQAEKNAMAKKLYDNPVTNAAVTMIEPFPVGLLITLISAALLRKKGQGT